MSAQKILQVRVRATASSAWHFCSREHAKRRKSVVQKVGCAQRKIFHDYTAESFPHLLSPSACSPGRRTRMRSLRCQTGQGKNDGRNDMISWGYSFVFHNPSLFLDTNPTCQEGAPSVAHHDPSHQESAGIAANKDWCSRTWCRHPSLTHRSSRLIATAAEAAGRIADAGVGAPH